MMVFILGLSILIGCTQNSIPAAETSQPKPGTKQRTVVTWTYLRAMAATGQNPTILKFLKDQGKLVPTESERKLRSNIECWKEGPWSSCSESSIDFGGLKDEIASMRVDLPIKVNGQPMTLTVTVVYKVSTGEAIAYGTALYGNNTPQNSSYVPTVANYSNGQMTVIGNLQYNYTTSTAYTIGANAGGSGQVGPVGVNVGVNGEMEKTYSMTSAGIIYVNVSVNLGSGYGGGTVQLNGPSGPKFDYAIEPQN